MTTLTNAGNKRGPLDGLRVLEMGQLLAGPFASMLLAWFGAEVIKIEPPGAGDPLRKWRALHNGTALWWYILGRNKKCVTLNLRAKEGQEIVRQLIPKMDVVLENFKPGTLERWGLGYETLKKINPQIIMARISGWGQTGPWSGKPGFASVAEGVGGLRYVTGYPDRPPVRPNLSLGDTLAGLHAALGILLALHHRDKCAEGAGQMIDVAIYEAVYNMMEGIVPEYDKCGIIRAREGNRLTGIVPTGTYPCNDEKYVIIGGNSDNIFKRLMRAIGHPEMADDPRFEHNNGRVQYVDQIDETIAAWTCQRSLEQALQELEKAQVPVGPIYSVADMIRDAHFQARGLFETIVLEGHDTVTLPTLTPKLSETPGGTKWIGPPLGAHNQEVFGEMLGLSEERLDTLKSEGVI